MSLILEIQNSIQLLPWNLITWVHVQVTVLPVRDNGNDSVWIIQAYSRKVTNLIPLARYRVNDQTALYFHKLDWLVLLDYST